MHTQLLRSRAGFTLAEVLVALTMTAIIGAAITGAFVSQSKFFDRQEKVGSARNVSRAAVNIMTSEMRIVERSGGVTAANNSSVTLRVPYMMGLNCGTVSGVLRLSRLPADSAMMASAVYGGYAYRTGANTYTYVPVIGSVTPSLGTAGQCTAAGVTELTQTPTTASPVMNVPLGVAIADLATPVFLWQQVRYHFGNSTTVPGRRALFRTVGVLGAAEELLAPFDTTAKFRFYVNDAATAQDAAPGTLSNITGLEIRLDGLSERPNPDGSFTTVPFRTSVFFRNR